MSYAREVNRHNGEAFRPEPISLKQIMPRHEFHPIEDEDRQ
jgi:hypothetical protein